MGKPPSGVLNGDVKWLGSYDECLAVEASVNISGEMTTPYKGQYCSATFTVGNGRPVGVLLLVTDTRVSMLCHNYCRGVQLPLVKL